MPFRLVTFLAFVVLLALFLGFNLDNRCDVSVVFRTFRDVPVVVTILFAFAAGVVSVVPLLVSSRRRKGRRDSERERRAAEKAAGKRSAASRDKASSARKGSRRGRDSADAGEYGID